MKVLPTIPNCPKCKGEMVLRNKKNDPNSKFYGCKSFPRCNGIVSYTSAGQYAEVTVKQALRRILSPSDYQKNIFEWLLNGSGNSMISAVAGSGKTTVLEHLCSLILEGNSALEIVVLMFNSHIQKAAAERGMPAQTTHSLGLQAIKAWLTSKGQKNFPSNFVNNDKVRNIVCDLITKTWDAEKHLIGSVCDVVSKLKNTLAPTDDKTIEKITEKFNIETNGSLLRICELSRKALELSNADLKQIDFDDMLYIPIHFNIPLKKYDWILADESQDLNRAQIQLVLRSIKTTGRVIVVGDRKQSIYGFRGAAIDAMDMMQEALKAVELPLSITYRCPKSHVALVNRLFPHIAFEAAPNAEEGTINFCSKDKMLGIVQDGDLVLSRVNAALVGPVFTLIRRGVKAIIRGRDIGKGLIALIQKFEERATSVDHLLELLEDYKEREVSRLLAKNKATQAEALQDRVETLEAIAENCSSIREMISKIDEVFSDKKVGVVFSTVHRAKGDEADNIFILRPDLMPHPMSGVAGEAYEQELNILYVALTRAKKNLTFIGQIPSLPESVEEELDEEQEVLMIENKQDEVAVNEMIPVVALLPVRDETTDLSKAQEELLAESLIKPSANEIPVIKDCPF